MRAVEARWGKPLRVILLELRRRRQLTIRETAEELGVPEGTITNWEVLLDISSNRLAAERGEQLLAVEGF